MADFELLGVYVSIRTRGLATVLRDFSRVRAAAQQINRPFGDRALDQGVARIGRMLRDVQQMNNAVNRGVRSWERMNEAIGRALSNRAIRNGIAAFDQMVRSIREANRAINQGVAAWERMGRAIERQRQQMRQALNSISLEAGFIAPFTRLGGNIFRIAGNFQELARAAGLGTKAIRLFGIAGVVFGLGIKTLQITLNLLSAAIRTLARVAMPALRSAFQVLLGPTLAFLRAVRLLIQNLPILATVVGGVLTRSLIRAGTEFQRISSGFQFAFGPQAQGELSRVIALANRLGVPLEAVTENYVRISSAARDAGIAQSDVRQLLEGVGAAAVSLGLDVERVNGLFFAFEQVVSKGRLSSEELRRQIGDRLPGAFAIAARALSVTTAELDQLLERGAIDSATFIRAIGAELNRTFGLQAQRQANRLTAVINRLNTQFRLLQIDLAARIEPALVRVIQRITQLINAVRNSQAFRTFANFVVSQLLVIEANFERVVSNIRGIIAQLAPTFQRLGRLILVLNTITIGGLVESIRRLQPVFDGIIARIENFVTSLTGISFEGLGFNLQSVVAIGEAIPLIFDAIALRIRLAFERFRQFLSFVSVGLSSASSVGLRLIGGAVGEFANIVAGAYRTIQSDSEQALSMARELEFRWQTIGFVIKDSLDRTAVKQFENSLVALARRFVNLETGIVGLFGTLFGVVEQINASTRETLNLAAQAQQDRGTGQIVNITELRGVLEASVERRETQAIASATQGTEKNTSLIAQAVARLDQRVSELPDMVELFVRRATLPVVGGGLNK